IDLACGDEKTFITSWRKSWGRCLQESIQYYVITIMCSTHLVNNSSLVNLLIRWVLPHSVNTDSAVPWPSACGTGYRFDCTCDRALLRPSKRWRTQIPWWQVAVGGAGKAFAYE